jgi:hypothetical protein
MGRGAAADAEGASTTEGAGVLGGGAEGFAPGGNSTGAVLGGDPGRAGGANGCVGGA